MAEHKGVTTSDGGTYIPPNERVPYDEENKYLSKADFVKKQRLRREKEAQLKAYEKEIEKKQDIPKAKIKKPKKKEEPEQEDVQ